MTFIRRVGGERFFIYADGVRQPGYATSDEKAIDRCLEVLETNPELTSLTYKHQKETVVNIPALRAFAQSLNGVDNTNEGGPAPFPDVEITTTSLPSGQVGVPYSQQLAATGGDGGYAWTRISGTLPTGLSLSTGGLLSGTPTGSGTANFTVQADDELGNDNSTDTQALAITVAATDDPSLNPNDLDLVGSHSLASASGLPAFEVSGATYPDDYLRLTLEDQEEDGGSVKIGVGKNPDSYRGNNRLGDDEVLRVMEVAFELRVTGTVPRKLFRSIVFPDPADWREAAIGHVWFPQAGNGNLSSDPVRGVVGESVVTTQYNDFANFIWEGAVQGVDEIVDGAWHTVRIYHALNTSGNADGVCRVWIDGVLDIEDTGINFVDEYDVEYGWNSIFLEAFHNGGSPGGCTIDFRNLYVRGSDAAPLEVTTSSLPAVETGESYSQTLAATGGTTPYTWSIVSGSLSGSGLSLNSSTGAITGTASGVGSYSFTVRVEDDVEDTATRALSISVTAASGGEDPDWQEDWDYASTAAMVGQSHIENSSQGEPASGDISLLTGLTGTPWGGSKALRCTFLASGSGTDHQIGATLNMSSWSASAEPQEIWYEFYARPSANWTTDGPYTAGGGPGHKFVLMFDEDETTAGRWDIVQGLFDSYVTAMNMAGQSNGADRVRNAVGGDTAANFWDGDWHLVRVHALMHPTAGVFECMIDDTFSDIGSGVNTYRDGTKYFNKIALSRNINTGVASNQTLDFGPVSVYGTDPGWTFG